MTCSPRLLRFARITAFSHFHNNAPRLVPTECSVTGFVSSSGLVEKVPYVFLPQREQIIYPQAEIRFEGVATPVCGIAGSQQLGKSGWLELRNLSNAEPPIRLFRDGGRTFLQWIGEDGLRDAAEGKVVVAKLVCRDAAPNSSNPGVFAPCVAFRVAGSPSKTNIREVTFAATGQTSQGLSAVEYTAIGISSILLALIYVASVSLYLHSRKARKKSLGEAEAAIIGGREGAGLVKNNPLLIPSRHFESDTNSGHSDDDLGDDLGPSDGEHGYENSSHCPQQVTSAIIHPHCMYADSPEGPFGNGSILGERIPEEDVRIVETIENTYQHETPVLPGTQRRKLYFNPAYFERQLLLAPPPAAIEFLMKIREVISIAKHKMTAKRFVPTLTGIPEEESASERCSSSTKKPRASSVQESVARSRKSQRCTGCPGCTESPGKNMPQPLDVGRPTVGESRVRAWLEDVKTPERRWKDSDDAGGRNFHDATRNLARSFEYLREMAKMDFLRAENGNAKSLAMWKDNPAMLRSFQNIARSEILDNDDNHSVSRRSTKSMFEESNYESYYRRGKTGPSSLDASDNAINAKVRKAIENCFIKQMEENAVLDMKIENKMERKEPSKSEEDEEDEDEKSREEGKNCANKRDDAERGSKKSWNGTQKRWKKCRAPGIPMKELPDMINELPASADAIPAKKMMDAVIKEMVDVKVLENLPRLGQQMDYEVDSLERTNRRSNRQDNEGEKIGDEKSAEGTSEPRKFKDNESSKENGTNSGENDSRIEPAVLRRNYYNSLPELLSQRPEGYSLVSEVYVNDGYASPAGSDDSGPEIRYEPENPGHLTIKVQDSPENYVKLDESDYEPDTLDRKPMRLKINGDVNYDRDFMSETYVDSLERPGQIYLRSKNSFRECAAPKNSSGSALQRGYGSLREIYEARLRSNIRESEFTASTRSLNSDNTVSWKKKKYLTPDMKHAKRQRQQNHPDVVPLPPAEEIYQKPKPPRRVEGPEPAKVDTADCSKNELDRSKSEAVDPTASEATPVPEKPEIYDYVGEASTRDRKEVPEAPKMAENFRQKNTKSDAEKWSPTITTKEKPNDELEANHRRAKPKSTDCGDSRSMSRPNGRIGIGKVEDSGYLSSTDSNGSQKQLLTSHETGSVSETDETESMCDGASESGAESVGTDSVFFGNFRRLSRISNLSKSADSGLDFTAVRNPFFNNFSVLRNDCELADQDRSSLRASDSENESFVTILLPPSDCQRNSLVL